MNEFGNLNGHEERFMDLCALASSGSLSSQEMMELEEHLKTCSDCREAHQEYTVLAKEGIPSLAKEYAAKDSNADGVTDNMVEATRRKLLDRLPTPKDTQSHWVDTLRNAPGVRRRILTLSRQQSLGLAAAACLMIGLGAGAYRLGERKAPIPKPAEQSADPQVAKLTSEKIAVGNLVAAQAKELAGQRKDSERKEKELGELRVQLRSLEMQLTRAAEDKRATEAQLEEQRQASGAEFRQNEQAYSEAQAELVRLRSEREKTVLRLTALEREVDSLAAEKQEDRRRIKDQEEYLASDRDIRELMGARQLYIADVSDVSSDSRTRKPYGRIFYTKGKSLLFYAFDLDRQPGLKNVSTFQVWGKNESAQDRPVNLGVLFVDNEANRRWALRCDDPVQLAEIDAVFVTVEANTRSNKPVGKPFLYASLRKEPNHP